MACSPITLEEILETLSPEEQKEALRPDFKVPLQHYLTGFNRNQVFPRSAVLEKMRRYVKQRTAIKQTIAENPDILKTKINPIIIIGLPRSGTTMLQRLIHSDPQFLAPMLWELYEPLPPGRPENWRESERFKRASVHPEIAPLAQGYFDQTHFTRMDTLEECFHLMRPYFLDFLDIIPYADMKEMRQFMYNFPEDHATNTYQFLKMSLQCLFNGNLENDKKVILKSPIHCLYPEIMQQVFPSAKFIFPYRDAETMVTSFAHLINTTGKTQNKDDSIGSGQRALEFLKYTSERIVKFLKLLPEGSFVSIPYSKMITNPMDTVKRIYSHFNLSLTPEAEKLMQSHLEENYQYKYGKVEYTAEQFGITDELIEENMKDYLEYCRNGTE